MVSALTLQQKVQFARRAGSPLIVITTPDMPILQKTIVGWFDRGEKTIPIIGWDIVRGIYPLSERAVDLVTQLGGGTDNDPTKGNPQALPLVALELPPKSVVIAHNWGKYCTEDSPVTVQGTLNIRDKFKANTRTFIALAPSFSVPEALKGSIDLFDEALPDNEQLSSIITQTDKAACEAIPNRPQIAPNDLQRAIGALRGLSAYRAENAYSQAARDCAPWLDWNHLGESKRAAISQVKGLSVERGTETFSDIGGIEAAKGFGNRLFRGRRRWDCVIRIEEIEKALSGSGKGSLSGDGGVSQDTLQVLLSAFEDNGWGGMLAFGPPGSGKSLYSKSLANTFGALPLLFDINAAKGGIVGQSEQQIREVVKTLVGIGGSNCLFVASMNSVGNLRPELLRRFRFGTWLFDLPNRAEKDAIWAIQRARYEISPDDPTPDDTDWSGADIRNICELAYTFNCPLSECLQYVTQVGRTSPETILDCRKSADGKFLSASAGGIYRMSPTPAIAPQNVGRSFAIAD